MTPQNVLIIGSGGREHALAWKIAQSPRLGRLYVAPGNGGTAGLAHNLDIKASDIPALVEFARTNDIHLTVVGPDDSLAAGVVDAFQAAGLRVFGPTQAAAQIEASKAFSKDLMTRAGIPTARHRTFTDHAAARRYLSDQTYPLVVKASGLALGKGVYICADEAEAQRALAEIMTDNIFGEAGNSVVIEDYLEGQEVSVHAFTDGHSAVLFPPAQDHKRIGTGDTGPNTGGMGAFAPVPWVKPGLMDLVHRQAVDPALAALETAGTPFTGVLYPGLMVDGNQLNILEFNARFGDPETEVFMRLLRSDLLDVLDACVDGRLSDVPPVWDDRTAVTVVLASAGYPGKSRTGLPITGLAAAAAHPDVVLFHAGTKQEGERIVTNGGRVLNVTAVGDDLADARAKAYAAIDDIHFEGMQYRTDIGQKAL